MNFTNKHKLFLNVFLLLFFSYLLAEKVITGINSQRFNYIRIIFNVIIIVTIIMNLIKFNKDESKQSEED